MRRPSPDDILLLAMFQKLNYALLEIVEPITFEK